MNYYQQKDHEAQDIFLFSLIVNGTLTAGMIAGTLIIMQLGQNAGDLTMAYPTLNAGLSLAGMAGILGIYALRRRATQDRRANYVELHDMPPGPSRTPTDSSEEDSYGSFNEHTFES